MSEWLKSGFLALMDFLFGSPEDNLKLLIATMAGDPATPDSWQAIHGTYNRMFGLSLILAIMGIFVVGVRHILAKAGPGAWVLALVDSFKLLMIGIFLPFFVMVLVMAKEEFTRAIINLAAGDETSWQKPFTGEADYTSVVGGGVVRLVTQAGGMLLHLILMPFEMFIWVYLVLILIAYVLSKMLLPESRILQFVWSLVITAVVAEPILAIILVVGGKQIGVGNPTVNSTQQAIGVMFLTLGCLVAFFLILTGNYVAVRRFVRSKMDVEGSVDIDGSVDVETLDRDIAEVRSALNEPASSVAPRTHATQHITDLAFDTAATAARSNGRSVVGGAIETAHVYIKARRKE